MLYIQSETLELLLWIWNIFNSGKLARNVHLYVETNPKKEG